MDSLFSSERHALSRALQGERAFKVCHEGALIKSSPQDRDNYRDGLQVNGPSGDTRGCQLKNAHGLSGDTKGGQIGDGLVPWRTWPGGILGSWWGMPALLAEPVVGGHRGKGKRVGHATDILGGNSPDPRSLPLASRNPSRFRFVLTMRAPTREIRGLT